MFMWGRGKGGGGLNSLFLCVQETRQVKNYLGECCLKVTSFPTLRKHIVFCLDLVIRMMHEASIIKSHFGVQIIV